jgi:hypothetical protein
LDWLPHDRRVALIPDITANLCNFALPRQHDFGPIFKSLKEAKRALKWIDLSRGIMKAITKTGCVMHNSMSDPKLKSLLTRRALVGSLLSLCLTGCADSETVSIRYRVIAKITYYGKPYEASTVMECRYTRVKHSLVGMGGATRLYGEALIFDLPDKSTFYLLPVTRDPSGPLLEFYEHVLPLTFGLKTSVGSLSDSDLQRLKAAKGRVPLNASGRLPVIAAFKDESDPKTIFQIDPTLINRTFPGVKFVGIDIEITADEITENVRRRLPWLIGFSGEPVFDRYGPGRNVPYRDRPLGYLVTTDQFFGNGSR